MTDDPRWARHSPPRDWHLRGAPDHFDEVAAAHGFERVRGVIGGILYRDSKGNTFDELSVRDLIGPRMRGSQPTPVLRRTAGR
jgi:hypothetical protein